MIFSGSTSDNVGRILTPDEIRLLQPERLPVGAKLASAKERMQTTNQWDRSQFMGRRWPIGCVALEITQRCNLDCTACYLSENSEAVKDVPLEEIFRRIEMIFDHYGPGTGVQVTGGDPTLRQRKELVDIVRRIAEKGMQPALFTNGIRAKKDLLAELAEAGLVDVVFHVDMTQRRRGFDSEAQLNRVRQNYVDHARGLPIAVMFNTTVTNENFDQIPDVAAFFVRNSDIVRLASFQVQADTGRGTFGRRGKVLTMKSVQGQIETGANASISFDTARIGHVRCNRYAMTFVANGQVYDALDNVKLFQSVLEGTAHRGFDRRSKTAVAGSFLIGLARRPRLLPRILVWLAKKLWLAKADILAARGRVNKLSFFIHNFMDASNLEKQRLDACSFMVATQAGPISMCLHNAKRDDFILAPLRIGSGSQARLWDPLTGNLVSESVPSERVAILWNNKPRKPRKAANAS